jgi:hypothetical protein
MTPRAAACAFLLAAAGPAPAQLAITDPAQGVFNFPAPTGELSGLTWLAAASWLAISDAAGERRTAQLDITIDPATGRITNARQSAAFSLAAGYDLEGIAWSPQRHAFFVSDEGAWPDGGHLREHSLPDGDLLRTVPIPAILLNDRQNFGFESCSWNAGALWTANEEALAHESALASATEGSLVRIQKFNHLLQPAGQWAYRTDSFGVDSSLTTLERSGVSDLCALPDGQLLVLERTLGTAFLPSYRNRIYLVSFAAATDTSNLSDLDSAPHVAVTKTLLWERNLGSVATRNFEGIALGPPLPALGPDAHALVLIADNGGDASGSQHLYPLVLRGLSSPSPAALWRMACFGSSEPSGDAHPTADPDADGLPNLTEYALGGDPLSPASHILPSSLALTDSLGLSFRRSPARTDLTLTVESATSPAGPWSPIAASTAGNPFTPLTPVTSITESGPAHDPLVVVSLPANPSRLFLRLAIASP